MGLPLGQEVGSPGTTLPFHHASPTHFPTPTSFRLELTPLGKPFPRMQRSSREVIVQIYNGITHSPASSRLGQSPEAARHSVRTWKSIYPGIRNPPLARMNANKERKKNAKSFVNPPPPRHVPSLMHRLLLNALPASQIRKTIRRYTALVFHPRSVVPVNPLETKDRP